MLFNTHTLAHSAHVRLCIHTCFAVVWACMYTCTIYYVRMYTCTFDISYLLDKQTLFVCNICGPETYPFVTFECFTSTSLLSYPPDVARMLCRMLAHPRYVLPLRWHAIYLSLPLSLSLYIYTYIYIYMYVCISIYLAIHIICIYIYTYKYIFLSLSLYIYIYIQYIYIYIYTHIHTYIHICSCPSGGTRGGRP